MKLKDLKKGAYFKTLNKKGVLSVAVYVKGDYDRATKSYCVWRADDINAWKMLKASSCVSVDFEY